MNVRILAICVLVVGAMCAFPKDFIFGTATAAFQVEGAWLDEGKSPSVWDNLAHLPNYTADGTAPDVGANSYYLCEKDIEMLKLAGIKHYRMSISWPRIVPQGRANSPINVKGVNHYKQMLKNLTDAGITPYVTLYHWDLPAILAIQGYGLVDKYFKRDFLYFAETCFKEFGDVVKFWFTFNEPWVISVLNDFKERDKGKKPYLIAHNLLLTHAATVELYRTQYKESQKGQIGMVFNSDMFLPKDPNKPSDKSATDRANAFMLWWFADPVWFGDYPEELKKRVGVRLPSFTAEEKKLLKGSADFFALNHYTSQLCEEDKFVNGSDYWSDRNVKNSARPEWQKTDMGWAIYPEGFHDLLVHIQTRYLKEGGYILVTENGMANYEPNREVAQNDQPRIDYLRDYLKNLERALTEDKVNIKGYFVWSLIDNFEWWSGFSKRFGMVRIEVGSDLTRFPKKSLLWYRDFIRDNSLSSS